MTATTNNVFRNTETKSVKKEPTKNILLEKYLAYADSKSKDGILYYLKVVIFIPCVFMVFSIMAMASITPNYVWFVGLTILLFYVNMIAHIAGVKSRVFVPIYHATIFIMMAIPAITYLIS